MALRQIEPTKVTVNNCNFYITPFPAFKAANLSGELASTLAPLLGAIVPLIEDSDLMDVDVNNAAKAMMNCSAINGDRVEVLMKKLLLGGHIVVEIQNENGEIEPQRLDMDMANEIFCGEIQDMFVLCFYVIKLNFNSFFKKVVDLYGKAKQKEGTAKEPRKIL